MAGLTQISNSGIFKLLRIELRSKLRLEFVAAVQTEIFCQIYKSASEIQGTPSVCIIHWGCVILLYLHYLC